jgi:hypothetical protein
MGKKRKGERFMKDEENKKREIRAPGARMSDVFFDQLLELRVICSRLDGPRLQLEELRCGTPMVPLMEW